MKKRIKKIIKKIISKIKFPIIDIGGKDDLIILAGMGRSGTTWGSDIINYDSSYRVLFEPFLPARVKEAKGFKYIQYINPNDDNAILVNQAKTILSGKVRNSWVDMGNSRFIYRRRIIKDIRCNLMLGWLKKIANNPPVVLMVRHPLQVVSSWKKIGWGKEAMGEKSDLQIITSQKALLKDFPIIAEVMKDIDADDFVQNIVFQWCIFHLIPLHQLKKNDFHILYYENLLIDQEREIANLFQYLNKPIDKKILEAKIGKPSATNYLKRDFSQTLSSNKVLNGWKEEFSAAQIKKTNEIVARFGLDDMYDDNGLPTGTYQFKG